ncbi:hypothetical protein PybrP1_002910 [[Pythium] brassicae (nom. inval.)]|nr:hypothetical protein PybrP1_002910 [[Pythium] brassicae (nom. inval.)]
MAARAPTTPTFAPATPPAQFAGYSQPGGGGGGGFPSSFAYQQQQQQLYKQQQQAKLAPPGRYSRDRPVPVRGQQKSPVSAKMGIKSGMTVEVRRAVGGGGIDLKRLTQKRMQQSAGAPAAAPVAPSTPVAAPQDHASRPSTPTLNLTGPSASAPPPPPIAPKTGMTVQELKQLTSLRLASQSAPMRQTEITGLVSKAVLTNVAKSHYRDSLRNSLTPNSTPKRGPMAAGARGAPSALSLGVPEVRGNRSRSRSSQLTKTVEPPIEATQMRYSYSGGQTIDDYLAFDTGADSSSSQETDSYARPSLEFDDDNRFSSYEEPTSRPLQFPEDSFPPPPPMDENGGFMSFYNQQTSYYNIASKEEAPALDQNAVIAPPPGLSRRPSMTVPWQVAEAVLNTPQTGTGRKQLQSPSKKSGGGGGEPESANMFANPKTSSRVNAAEAAAHLSAMSLQAGRPRSGTGGGSASAGGGLAPPPAPPQPLTAGARRGSFGNAAEFFKFRRRSKSRLELARDLSGNFVSEGEVVPGFPNYGTSGGAMPGIDEVRVDVPLDGFAGLAHADTVSDASSSSSSDNGSSSQGYDDDEVVQITGGYDDPTEIAGNFVSFYHATGAGRSRDSGLASLSIPPPPPPPPLTDDEDASSTTSSATGLPVMSPNGLRLRKVAELARRGSLSSEDKTRAKDEIIQHSLGIGASNAARIFSAKMAPGTAGGAAAGSAAQPPPGFAMMASAAAPPRDTPKATAAKSLAPGAGIVRGGAVAGASRKGLGGGDAPEPAASLEERLASAAQRVADCVSKGDMAGFQGAMDELDWLRNEASSLMRG